jgi:energy-coupling factor transport system ATP-binding protein
MIKIKNLNFGYGRSDSLVLRRVNLHVSSGQMVLITGPTGGGKSTFLKCLNGLAPHFTGGEISGEILIDGSSIVGKFAHDLADLVGFVNQQPEGAFACDTVEEELAFGLEQLGWNPEAMHSRVLELADTFQLQNILERPLVELSGGEQQRVAVAAALAAGQKVLLLDEPTSALDQTSSATLLRLLKKLAAENGITVLLAEHRIDRVLPLVDTVLSVDGDGSVRQFEPADYGNVESLTAPKQRNDVEHKVVFSASGLSKKYGQTIALAPMDLAVRESSIIAVVGENGSGKTSLLWCALRSAQAQKYPTAMVPQNAADLLFLPTLSEELAESDSLNDLPPTSTAKQFETLAGRVDPSTHPRDLSAGQQLALVLAIQISTKAKLLILDEPTRGLDLRSKAALREQLIALKNLGHSILLASHDLSFVNGISDEVITMRAGKAGRGGDNVD